VKIGILQADSVLEHFQSEFGDYPDMFQDMLVAAASSPIEIAHYDVEHGQYPERINECDGYVITGSKKSVYDDEDWIHQLRQYVVELNDVKKKLVGICFGHQMVALALGGVTQPASVGWGVGVHTSEVINKKNYMVPTLQNISAIVSHKDQVTKLPEGAQLLATSEFCPNSMFQIQDHILTFQGHPEFCKSYSKALMDMRQEVLGDAVYTSGIKSLEQNIQGEALAQWIIQFISGEPS